MRSLFVSSLILFLLSVGAASAADAPTVEENTVMEFFILHVSAPVYDEACNKPPLLDSDMAKSENINYFGNTQMIAARVGGLMHVRKSALTPEEGAKRLLEIKDKIASQYKARLDKDGCQSEAAEAGAKALKLNTAYHPSVVYSFIDKRITDSGGSITPFEAMENPRPKQ